MSHGTFRRVLRAAAFMAALSVNPSLAANRCVPVGHPGPCTTFHSTIQAAVDAAADGDSILVAAGTYSEQVTVAGKSIALLGARAGEDARGRSGPESVIADPAGPLSLCGDGASVDGFTLSGAVDPDAAWAGLVADASLCGAQVQMRVENNIVEDNIVGMALGAGPLRVRHNWFRHNDALPGFSHGVLGGLANDWTFEENLIEGHAVSSVTVHGAAARLTLARNRFDRGLAFDRTVDSLLEGNVGLAPAPGVVLLAFTGDDHRVVVRDNALRADAGVAIQLSNGSGGPASGELSFHGNCIVGLGAIGLEVPAGTYSGSLDATGNWWGSTTGPSGVGPGGGSAIVDPTGAVQYAPFVGAGGTAACDCSIAADGSPCEDGNPCTTGSACSAGQCTGGQEIDCDDNNPCTIDSCSNPGGCTHTPMDCNDNNACTTGDYCEAGTCHPGVPRNCDDGNFCTDDSCDASDGSCVRTNHDGPCSDDNACTLGDQCVNGQCEYDHMMPCADGNPCTDDLCNPADGSCYFVNDNTNVCATGDECVSCSAGACVPGCDDGDRCTADACVPGTGCTHTLCPVDEPCRFGYCDPTLGCQVRSVDGGNCHFGCTWGTCQTGFCVTSHPPETCGYPENCGLSTCDAASGYCVDHPDACDDGLPCTADFCGEFGACRHLSTQCDDGDPCTNDSCDAGGTCTHSAVSCDDGNPCTDDTCTGGGCVSTIDNSNACAGSGLCSVGGQCVDGACVSSPGPAAEVQGVRFLSKSSLGWNLAPSGPGFAYDIVRGNLAGLPVGSSPGSESCLGHTTLNPLADAQTPAAGAGYWYLVRVSYSACDGMYGFQGINGTPGAARATGTCP